MTTEQKPKLIVNADDFAYSHSVSKGIIEAYKNGIVTSTTMMVTMPAAEASAKLALENPGLGVGIHLVLTAGRPLIQNLKTLIREDGTFMRPNVLPDTDIDINEVEREYRAQLERFLSFGLKPTHFDSHHHMHADARIYPVVEKLAIECNIPVRKPFDIPPGGVSCVESFIDSFYGEDATEENLTELLKNAVNHKSSELMCH